MDGMHSVSDEELVSCLQNGDERALEAIYKKYWEQLFISAFNVLKDRQACEDIIQEVFIRLWNGRRQLEISVSLRAYLFASIRYEVYRQIRAGRVRADIFDLLCERLHMPASHGFIEYKELVARVSAIIDTLPGKCREVYRLSREEYLSHKEIASRLQISTKTVENHLTKALRHLRASLTLSDILLLAVTFLLSGDRPL